MTDVTLNLVNSTVTDAPALRGHHRRGDDRCAGDARPAATLYVDFREAGRRAAIVHHLAASGRAQFPNRLRSAAGRGDVDPARSYVVGARILLGDQVLYAPRPWVSPSSPRARRQPTWWSIYRRNKRRTTTRDEWGICSIRHRHSIVVTNRPIPPAASAAPACRRR